MMHSFHELLSKQNVGASLAPKKFEALKTGGSWKKSPERIYMRE
jgi:hypothetical protein